MKAAAILTPGPPSVLQVMEFEDPKPKSGQVRVQVKAAGIQPFDLAVRSSGWAPPGLEVRYPQILGNEFAGIIDQIGDEVTDFSVGDEVVGWAMLACYAEYVVVNVNHMVPKPKNMPWPEAGAITASGQTAHTALTELGVTKGDTVLIHAAAGGVGTIAVQLAREWGATVIGTASEKNQEYLRLLGAIPLVYGDGLVHRVRALAPNGVDVAFDAAGDEALQASVELVQNKDRIGTIVTFELAEKLGVRMIRSQRSVERLSELTNLYAQGKLQIHIRKTFLLHQAADAHLELESGHGRGKVVLTIP